MKTMDQLIAEHTLHAIWVAGGNKAKAAKLLGISRRSIYRYIKTYKISVTVRPKVYGKPSS